MKRSFALVLIAICAAVRADADMAPSSYAAPPSRPINTPYNSDSYPANSTAAKAPAGVRKVEVSVAMEAKGKAATTFPANASHLFAVFKTHGTKKGEQVRGVWISQTSKKKLSETTLTGNQADFVGSFSIKGPATGWPPGKYRVEVYLGNKLAATANFTMSAKGG